MPVLMPLSRMAGDGDFCFNSLFPFLFDRAHPQKFWNTFWKIENKGLY